VNLVERLINFKAGLLIACLLIQGYAAVTRAQQQKPSSPDQKPANSSAATEADVKSIDAIMTAVYDVISGPAGSKRNWDRMKSLFIPGARLIPTNMTPAGTYASHTLSVDDYISRAEPFFEKDGFYEKEVARRTESFGQIAHVFSTYESRHAPGDPKPFQRGINSFQLMNDGTRWWVVTIFWQGEDQKNPLPEKYLKN
jgi:hypothetical protein